MTYKNIDVRNHTLGSGRIFTTCGINRPQKANALDSLLLEELDDFFTNFSNDHRLLLLYGVGKHFSAGADLGWMKDSARLSYDENLADAGKLTQMFEALCRIKVPVISYVSGACYGGAVGLVAASDFAYSDENAKFALSEVGVGLIPAVIMPYIGRKIGPGALREMALTGLPIGSTEAIHSGLVQDVFADPAKMLCDKINGILRGSPQAQKQCKALIDALSPDYLQSPVTADAIAQIRQSSEGQAGLESFFNKSAAVWVDKIDQKLLSFMFLEREE